MAVGGTLWLPGLPDQVGLEAIFKNWVGMEICFPAWGEEA